MALELQRKNNPKNILSQIVVEKIGLVDRPAIGRRFLVLKGASEMDKAEYLAKLAETELEKGAEIDAVCKSAKLDASGTMAVEIVAKALSAHQDVLTADVLTAIAKASGIEIAKAAPKPKPAPKDDPAIPAEVRAELAKRDEELAVLRKAVEDQKATEIKREYLAKAAAYVVPQMTCETIADVLRIVDVNGTKEQADAVAKHFATVTELIKSQKIFEQIGRVGGDDIGGDRHSRIDAKAKEAVIKAQTEGRKTDYYAEYARIEKTIGE